MYSIAVCLFLTIFGDPISAACPPIEDLPVLVDDNTFTCAVLYYDQGNEEEAQVCN